MKIIIKASAIFAASILDQICLKFSIMMFLNWFLPLALKEEKLCPRFF